MSLLQNKIIVFLLIVTASSSAFSQDLKMPNIALDFELSSESELHLSAETIHVPRENTNLLELVSAFMNDEGVTYSESSFRHHSFQYSLVPILYGNNRVLVALDVYDSATKSKLSNQPFMAMIDTKSQKKAEFGFYDEGYGENIYLTVSPSLK